MSPDRYHSSKESNPFFDGTATGLFAMGIIVGLSAIHSALAYPIQESPENLDRLVTLAATTVKDFFWWMLYYQTSILNFAKYSHWLNIPLPKIIPREIRDFINHTAGFTVGTLLGLIPVESPSSHPG